jgi:hypothetical protein
VKTKDLPESLKGIGLAMDHRKHVIARDDTCAKCHEKYKAPGTAPDKAVTFTEVNHMACDSCHSMASHSYRAGRLLRMTDREFTLARAESWDRLSGNPRWMVPIPTEASCRRCHNGKIHFKSKIFEANCRNGKIFEDCVKCHPGMTKEYFDKYRRERSITAETQGKLSDARPIPSDAMGKHSNHAVE